jgi:hypothetical protein
MDTKRAIVNVSSGAHFLRGQKRLYDGLDRHDPASERIFWNKIPADWPQHIDRPPGVVPAFDCLEGYEFKAFALAEAAMAADLLLWCDSSILPIRSLVPLWARIERDGYWFAQVGPPCYPAWSNYEWTADAAYPHLFPDSPIAEARVLNKSIPQVYGTAFGIDTRSEIGATFLKEFHRLALTGCFRVPRGNPGTIGGADVLGTRQDQTVASVLAWRLGMKLTTPPDVLTEKWVEPDERTILVIDREHTWTSAE